MYRKLYNFLKRKQKTVYHTGGHSKEFIKKYLNGEIKTTPLKEWMDVKNK